MGEGSTSVFTRFTQWVKVLLQYTPQPSRLSIVQSEPVISGGRGALTFNLTVIGATTKIRTQHLLVLEPMSITDGY